MATSNKQARVNPAVSTPITQPVVEVTPITQQTTAQGERPMNSTVTITQQPTPITFGKGYSTDIQDAVPISGGRGRQAGSGRIVQIVAALEEVKQTPEYHGRWKTIFDAESAQAATTQLNVLKKKYAPLTEHCSFAYSKSVKYPETGRCLIVKYGIPVASTK